MRGVLVNAVPYGMDRGSGTHAAQHLGECTVQTAQTALKGGFPLAVVLRRRLPVLCMRSKVREGDLLRENQHKDAGQVQANASHAARIAAILVAGRGM